MSKVIDDAYESCKIGSTVWIKPDCDKGQTLEMFQIDVNHAEELERKGYIKILHIHIESETSLSYTDLIQFVKLK